MKELARAVESYFPTRNKILTTTRVHLEGLLQVNWESTDLTFAKYDINIMQKSHTVQIWQVKQIN